jgi:hypothetical protein
LSNSGDPQNDRTKTPRAKRITQTKCNATSLQNAGGHGGRAVQNVFFLPSQIFLPNLPEVQQQNATVAPKRLDGDSV